MSALTSQPMTVEEYLRTEQDSPVKREYVGGFVYPLHGETRAQAGTSRTHMGIGLNIGFRLRPAAQQAGCRLSLADMKLLVDGLPSFYYPDVMVACGPQEDEYYERLPCLLVEVLSPRTENNDRRGKLEAYRTIPTLNTYLIVSQTERRVIAYERGADGWQMTQHVGTGEIALACPPVTLTLDEVYSGLTGLS